MGRLGPSRQQCPPNFSSRLWLLLEVGEKFDVIKQLETAGYHDAEDGVLLVQLLVLEVEAEDDDRYDKKRALYIPEPPKQCLHCLESASLSSFSGCALLLAFNCQKSSNGQRRETQPRTHHPYS